jgi:hypothetical protein
MIFKWTRKGRAQAPEGGAFKRCTGSPHVTEFCGGWDLQSASSCGERVIEEMVGTKLGERWLGEPRIDVKANAADYEQ